MPYPLQRKRASAFLLLPVVLLFISSNVFAQIKWDGEAGDGNWSTAANWVGNIVPGAADNVVLDNSFVSNSYTVVLPTNSVTIRTIAITANTGNVIELLLPSTNSQTPAFTTTGMGYGINIGSGGVLQNSSGAASGAAIVVADSIKINNGGQYTHNTRSSHAALVAVLSIAPGTEKGVFKFDVPGGGYTFSASNRNYGSLQFSADASAGTQTYSATGVNTFTINGNLIIKAGVTINLDITGATIIKGNYLQEAGVFNIANATNDNTIYIQGDLLQTAGTITETSTGLPTVELNGSNQQHIQMGGIVANSVSMRINNNSGAQLQTNLSLPYKLILSKGVVDCNNFLLTLLTGCGLQADSTTNCFISGALRKEGLSSIDHFLFPVGKGITQRWLELKNATGNYTVEFFKANPHALSATTGAGIHHTSSIEYWAVKPDVAPLPATQVELSFDNVNSGGVTAMPALRVAQLQSGIWNDAGNTATTGSAGAAGSVVSNSINTFESGDNYFTLASSDAFQNPLPLLLHFFTLEEQNKTVLLKWETTDQWLPAYFELQSSDNGIHFETVAILPTINNRIAYEYADNRLITNKRYYRLKMTENSDSYIFSNQLSVTARLLSTNSIAVWPSVVSSNANLVIVLAASGNTNINICDAQGRIIQTRSLMLSVGDNRVPLLTDKLKPGVYTVTVMMYNKQPLVTRFVKVQ